jgi:hypothetical protein
VSAITRSSPELPIGFTVASLDFLDDGGLKDGAAAAATTFSYND